MLGISATAFSGVTHLMYGFLENISRQMFVDNADEYGLTRWGNILGLPREAPTYATGYVAFTGVSTYIVVEGTVVVNGSGIEYETQDDFIIDTDTMVEIVATTEGVAGNTSEDTLSLSVPDVSVNTEVDVISGLDDGADLELLESWRLRLLQRLQNPPGSGNAADYVRWALSVANVDNAWCIPEYSGSGTVAVVVSKNDFESVGSTVLTDVETYIESVKPVPAAVTYLDINPIPVIYTIEINPYSVELQDAISEKLNDLHLAESGPGNTLLLSHIRAAISSSGVNDYGITDIDVDGSSIGVNNITSSTPDTPVFDSCVFSAL
jgi:uncharacterized phage protein gp47/JayE